MSTCGTILQKLRGGLSKEEVARRGAHVSGIVGAALVHWEADRRIPSPLQLITLVELYRASTEDVLALVQACAAVPGTLGGTYRCLLASWPGELSAEMKQTSFSAWARAQEPRARRSR